MLDFQDVVAAGRNLAKAHLHDGCPLNEVKVDYDRPFTEDEIIEAIAGCYVNARRIPIIERGRDGRYRFTQR